MSHENETREEFNTRIEQYDDLQDLTLIRKEHEYGDVYTFYFASLSPIEFVPGQYAHVVLDTVPEEAGKPVRYLSMASAPSDETICFTTHVRGGSDHKEALSKLEEGDSIRVYKIKGDFVLPDGSRPVVLIAGGIGITPYRSMMREEMNKGGTRDLTLVHVCDDEYLYKTELETYPFRQRRIKREELDTALEELVEMKGDAVYFVSGPPGFVDKMKEKLEGLGIKEDDIKQDWFDGYDDND